MPPTPNQNQTAAAQLTRQAAERTAAAAAEQAPAPAPEPEQAEVIQGDVATEEAEIESAHLKALEEAGAAAQPKTVQEVTITAVRPIKHNGVKIAPGESFTVPIKIADTLIGLGSAKAV